MIKKENLFELTTPDLGDAEKIELAIWYVKPEENIEKGQEILELVTDKAAFPVESPYSGRLIEICIPKGSNVQRGQVLGVMEILQDL
ncbi:MAG: lipoyl domain-containing protein [Leptospiraceae bacterium]|nr:hypothetical protein [Leptospiraceae bacterium]MCK6381949.1 lipoyl domain-containing protein [Leptospiraceae bacterium]NUM41822.1 hypothetical protein [Leptospiraceae bacterium]